MIYRLPLRNVKDILLNQISNNYFKSIDDEMLISKHLPTILQRFEECISQNDNKYYYKKYEDGTKEAYFDPLHTCQWFLFLYLTANTIYRDEKEKVDVARLLCDKIYGQSKTVSGCDIYYEVEMPKIFSFDHPTGSFMDRAKYGNYFSFTEGCTVGSNTNDYPVIGEHVTMQSGSRILGKSHIGNNCIICAGTVIKDENIPDNSRVYGISPNLKICSMEEGV